MEAILKARQAEGEASLPYWQKAIGLYHDPLLHGMKGAWIKEFRDAFQTAYLEALCTSARISNDPALQNEYLQRYLTILEDDPFNEALHQSLLEIYLDLGRRDEAVKHYMALEQAAKKANYSLSTEFRNFAEAL